MGRYCIAMCTFHQVHGSTHSIGAVVNNELKPQCTCNTILEALANPNSDWYPEPTASYQDPAVQVRDFCAVSIPSTRDYCLGSLYDYCPLTCNGNGQLYSTDRWALVKHMTARSQFKYDVGKVFGAQLFAYLREWAMVLEYLVNKVTMVWNAIQYVQKYYEEIKGLD